VVEARDCSGDKVITRVDDADERNAAIPIVPHGASGGSAVV